MIKRGVDVVGALVGVLVLAPLFLVVAVAIKLDSKGPVFYSQLRVGRHGKTFRLHKFRSMVVTADRLGPILTTAADPRVTRVGRVIRRSRLDELPQLLNVIRGEMSLVGPRPELPSIVQQYTPEQREVLEVRPGLAGPTQLDWLVESDRYPAGADTHEHYTTHFLPEKLRSDLAYVRTRTLTKDAWCLIRLPVALGSVLLSGFDAAFGRRMWRLAIDSLAVTVAHLGAFAARFEGQIPDGEVQHVVAGAPLTCLAYGLAFLIMRTHRGPWEYASIEELQQIVRVSVLGGGLHALAVVLVGWRAYPRSIVVSTALLTMLLLGGIRLLARSRGRGSRSTAAPVERRAVVIIGSGRPGQAIAREMADDPALGYDLIGFVDDDARRHGETIHGLPVLGTVADLGNLVRIRRVDEAIIAMPGLANGELRRVSDACVAAGLAFKTLPSLTELVRGEGRLRYLRRIDVNDLLWRERTGFDEDTIERFLRGKRVMVTGAGGSIGSELCRQVARLGAQSLIMVERAENPLHEVTSGIHAEYPQVSLIPALADIKHGPRMREIFARFRPHIVLHAAAYKHVPLLEDHPGEAVLNNVIGTVRVARMASEWGAEEFVLISTDKAARPKSLMGATKRICEMYVAALGNADGRQPGKAPGTRYVVVRFGNVLGSNGSVMSVFQDQIERGRPLTITDPDVSRFFMTATEAAGLVLQSASMRGEGSLFILDMGSPVKIARLADDLVLALGLSPGDVGREYIGLRRGEKMHEILWDEGEVVMASPHRKIFVIQQEAGSLTAMEALAGDLERLALGGDVRKLLERVSEIVPSYRPGTWPPPDAGAEPGEARGCPASPMTSASAE